MDNLIPASELLTMAAMRIALLGQSAAPDESPKEDVGFLTRFLSEPLNLLMLAVMLFFAIVVWPQQRQAKARQLAHQQSLAGMKKNDRIITSGGIHGVIVQANPDEPVVTIRIDEGSGARMTVNRDAVVKVFTEA